MEIQRFEKDILLGLQMSSIGLTTVGAIVGSVTLNPIVIGCLTGSGVLIQRLYYQK